MTVTVTTRGARELALRFDHFPPQLQGKLEERIGEITTALYGAVSAAAIGRFAHPTGLLQSEVRRRVYGDSPDRVAGVVSVFAGGDQNEYAKAATLEYGSKRGRKVAARAGSGAWMRITGSSRRVYARISSPAVIAAYRYLRDPLDEARPEIVAALTEAISEVIAEEDIGVAA